MRVFRTAIIFTVIILLTSAFSEPRVADSQSISLSATVLSRSNCRFSPPNATTTLNFGNLNPANPSAVTASTTINYRCGGSAPMATFMITADDGQHSIDGSRSLQSESDPDSHIHYAVSLCTQSATIPRNTDQTLTVTGTINGDAYLSASPGSYADILTLLINP
jgi:hypothetical protein